MRAASTGAGPRTPRPPAGPTRPVLPARTGGIVPEVAARAHLRWMLPVLDEAIARAGLHDAGDVDAIAATFGPGLARSRPVGRARGGGRGRRPPRPGPASEGPAARSPWICSPTSIAG